jgi:UDP:flavonoid glycosyltransferase YjiC (YdhE family)
LKKTDEEPGTDRPLSPLHEEDRKPRPDIVARLSALSQHPSLDETAPIPKLNIVIMVIGSRGDIQPFLKVGKLLKEDYGHRVRIATHPAFKKFVEQDSGLEFFSVGGDPAELMAFMVKNPGLMPSVSTVRAGEIGRRRDSMFEMFQGFWRACINATDDETDASNLKMMGDRHPFVADAIIANPPSFAHIHCAERLGVPLHLMFTFPYSPTQQFPHPLANIKKSNVDTNYTNFMSYPLVEMM